MSDPKTVEGKFNKRDQAHQSDAPMPLEKRQEIVQQNMKAHRENAQQQHDMAMRCEGYLQCVEELMAERAEAGAP